MTTTLRFDRSTGFDRLAIIVSGLCVVHCIASAVLVAMLSAVGGMLVDPIFHEIGLTVAIALGALGLGRGALQHGYLLPLGVGSLGLGMMAGAMTLPHDAGLMEHGEALWTIIGVGVLAFGHDLNRRADA
ncbi:MerC domain-containing protein [Sphingomonas sp. NBWT7]|uniref:MerC domain-containing protein n=1 Tax=Sphingomonas sp. NBWT7 TaxID=2596913 RepID=UPI00162A6DF7|nr:MerC domain-containing protein [Sphingomonas sp. NBWT7]QNE31447.1 MerC domain-containing protein [Sphingomonas sp. NBWT7]